VKSATQTKLLLEEEQT